MYSACLHSPYVGASFSGFLSSIVCNDTFSTIWAATSLLWLALSLQIWLHPLIVLLKQANLKDHAANCTRTGSARPTNTLSRPILSDCNADLCFSLAIAKRRFFRPVGCTHFEALIGAHTCIWKYVLNGLRDGRDLWPAYQNCTLSPTTAV